jgi:hypothetical protein
MEYAGPQGVGPPPVHEMLRPQHLQGAQSGSLSHRHIRGRVVTDM